MGIRELKLETKSWCPGELLDNEATFCHVSISYNIAGERRKVDSYINKIIEDEQSLKRISKVNTTLYWQNNFNTNNKEEKLVDDIKKELKENLTKFFVNTSDMSRTTATVYCQVGNFRAFLFEIDV